MSIEATLICVDNSEYSRNGDFVPNRITCQREAISLIASAKLATQYENSVGIIALAGERASLLHALSNDLNNFLVSLDSIKPGGNSDFYRGIQMAQFALKHRQNKNLKQRIICFVASPIVSHAILLIHYIFRFNNIIFHTI